MPPPSGADTGDRADADQPVDLAHLRAMTLGDPALEREVLGLFASQARGLMTRLSAHPDDAAALAHTVKGSARAIGAFAVADAAAVLETELRANRRIDAAALTRLDREVGRVLRAITAMLERRGQ